MKLKVFDRILLAILLIAAIVVSFVCFGIAANFIKLDLVVGFIELFYAYPQNAWILAGCGAVVLLISLKLLFAGRGEKKPIKPATTLIQQCELGGTYITLDAIDYMVQKHCRAQSLVRDCTSTVQTAEGGVKIGVRLSVEPDSDILSLTTELQKSLKEYIETLTGVKVLETGILVENAPVSGTSVPATRASM